MIPQDKIRLEKMQSWYREKHEYINRAPLSYTRKLYNRQRKELLAVRNNIAEWKGELSFLITEDKRRVIESRIEFSKTHEILAVNLIEDIESLLNILEKPKSLNIYKVVHKYRNAWGGKCSQHYVVASKSEEDAVELAGLTPKKLNSKKKVSAKLIAENSIFKKPQIILKGAQPWD